MAKSWTEEELAILEVIYSRPQSIESQAHLLPGRSAHAAKHRAERLGLVKVLKYEGRMCDKAFDLIEEHGPVSIGTLAALMHRSRQNGDSLIRQLRREERIHIAGFETVKLRVRNRTVKLWAAGNAKNVLRQAKPVEEVAIAEPVKPARIFVVPPRDALTSAFYGSHG